ncbi:MAG: peptide chain release factor 1 [Candidatus Caldatribacterium sp.]|uniref:peptide chain release factor 1 n=1 Tax=Candidatus Caldatribacterium sp. TaxID=2282143 RepID=UPI00299226B5|nr:peptide chain release factor 1 [Candidatus Caldatribacterium sp.]MCX7730967.1 peptide chain release factor 1 [Candidatus Caldatribacterium sp.]MDW8081476.1 peptide chain release factor 1 [Candidatus Calescibacterium sp.]
MWREKVKAIVAQYRELTEKMAHPEVIQDLSRYRSYAQTVAEIEPIVEKYEEYERVERELEEDRVLLRNERDPELRELLEEEIAHLRERHAQLEEELKLMLLPKDPRDEKNTLVEIRAGTGGDEAALFVADLFRMYTRFAERHGFRVEVMDASPTELGGFKEIIFAVEGKGAYSKFKFESGVHRVQRVPVTEASGRIHTSTATVAVLPEADEVEVVIRPEDIRVEIFRASGPGGQHVNTTDSAVRITHLPTGIVVTCQDERSQHKNKAKALRILRARLLELEQRAQKEAIDRERRAQIGTGERSERIRTYNFPQNRVTDHRINLTLYRLESVLDGDLDEIIEALAAEERAKLLEKVG